MVQGSGINASLNDTGEKQAEAFYQAYRHINFDKIYTSNLIRTPQSVQRFIDQGIPSKALADLREISWGSQEGKVFTPDTSKEYQRVCQRWTAGELETKIDGGENPIEVSERLARGFESIVSQRKEETVLVCVHGRVIRILITLKFRKLPSPIPLHTAE